MKKITLYNIISVVLLCTYVALLALQANLRFVPIDIKDFWFPTLVGFLGVSLFIRSIMLKSNSTLWFSLVLIGICILMNVIQFTSWGYYELWPLFVVIACISSLVVGLIKRDYVHIRVSICLAFISIPLLLFSFELIFWWVMLILLLVAIALSVVLLRYFPERWTMLKK